MIYLLLSNIHKFICMLMILYCIVVALIWWLYRKDVDRDQGRMQSSRLQLNVVKSALMLIGSRQKLKDHNVSILIGGRPLLRVISTKYLGVIINQH